MNATLNYNIHSKENIYFSIKLIITLLIILTIALAYLFIPKFESNFNVLSTVFLFYGAIIIFFILLRIGIFIGYIKGNAVKITETQFPEIYDILVKQSTVLGLKKIPDMFVLQAGGLLNALATRFWGKNFIVLYSDLFEEVYEKNKESVEFIIGHELGHIKRNHLSKRLWTFPSLFVPFLDNAYSRACEYTCDNIGASLSPQGVRHGLLLLASGKKLYSKVNMEQYIYQQKSESGLWLWLSEKFLTHPHLINRISMFQHSEFGSMPINTSIVLEKKESDHTKYIPQ